MVNFAANGSKAGMIMMEQDYLCSSTAQTAKDLNVGPMWFGAMHNATQNAGVDLQLCMMNPAHALASTLIHAASNGRGTGDHVIRNAARGLPLGWSSMLLWSLGMWPSRDNVWTNSSVNVIGLNTETNPSVQTAMAVLSGGPYGPADIAGAMNKTLIMQSCREDGIEIWIQNHEFCIENDELCIENDELCISNDAFVLGVLLRADKPATAIESVCFSTKTADFYKNG